MIRHSITRPSPKPRARLLVSFRLGLLRNENGDVLFYPISSGEVEIEEKKK